LTNSLATTIGFYLLDAADNVTANNGGDQSDSMPLMCSLLQLVPPIREQSVSPANSSCAAFGAFGAFHAYPICVTARFVEKVSFMNSVLVHIGCARAQV